MKKMTNERALALQSDIIEGALAILMKKRADYSGPDDPFRNFRKSELFGVEPWRGVLIRMTDKMSRIESIMEAGGVIHVTDEKLFDVFCDLVNYTCILAGLCEEELEC